jgi:hypothetical protein
LLRNELHVRFLNGPAKLVAVIGATNSLPANADAHGAPMHAGVLGNVNTFGGLLVRPQNVAQNIAALNRVAQPNAVTAKSITSKH